MNAVSSGLISTYKYQPTPPPFSPSLKRVALRYTLKITERKEDRGGRRRRAITYNPVESLLFSPAQLNPFRVHLLAPPPTGQSLEVHSLHMLRGVIVPREEVDSWFSNSHLVV